MEPHEAQRSRERERPPELLRSRPSRHRVEEGVDDGLGVVLEERPAEFGDRVVAEAAPHRLALTPRLGQPFVRTAHEVAEVVRVAPLAAFLRP